MQSNIWKLQVIQVLYKTMFFLPVLVLFLMDNGLSLAEIMILQSVFSFMIVFLEIPSGYFADVFSRRLSIILCSIFGVVGLVGYIVADSFYMFLIAETFFALASALNSGADSALMYDTLVELKQQKRFKKVWGDTAFYALVTVASASILGGFIAGVSLRWTFYAALPFAILSIPVAFSLVEPKRHKLVTEKGYTAKLFGIFKDIHTNIKLRWLIMYGAVIYTFTQVAFWLYQPYFVLSGLDILYFGFVFAAFSYFAAFCSKYMHRIESFLGMTKSLVLIPVLLLSGYMLMGNIVVWFSFIFAFFHQFADAFNRVVLADYIHSLTTSDVRATVMSAKSMLSKLLYAVCLPVIGVVADVYSVTQAMTIIGIIGFGVSVVLLGVLHYEKVW